MTVDNTLLSLREGLLMEKRRYIAAAFMGALEELRSAEAAHAEARRTLLDATDALERAEQDLEWARVALGAHFADVAALAEAPAEITNDR